MKIIYPINIKHKMKKMDNDCKTVNPNGFGQGIVYRNFDYTNKILLA